MTNSTVRIAGIANESTVDGPGLRCTIFFQGCPHACDGCHNPETWDPTAGREITLTGLISALKLNPLIKGVTFSGGEPLLQAVPLAELGGFLKKLNLNIWIYTGYTWEYLLEHSNRPGYLELLKVTDVLVDGPFKQGLKSLTLPFRGSRNQRLIQVPESLKTGTIVEWRPAAVT